MPMGLVGHRFGQAQARYGPTPWFVMVHGMVDNKFVCLKWPRRTPFGTSTWEYAQNQSPLVLPYILQNILALVSQNLMLTSSHNPYFFWTFSWRSCSDWTSSSNLSIHMALDNSIHPHTHLILPSRISKNVGFPCHLYIDGLWSTHQRFCAFDFLLPCVPPIVDPKVHTKVPIKPDSPPRGGSGGAFSWSTIIATIPNIFFAQN